MPESLVRYAVMMVILSIDKDIKILEVLQRAPAACALLQKTCTPLGLGRPIGKDPGIYWYHHASVLKHNSIHCITDSVSVLNSVLS